MSTTPDFNLLSQPLDSFTRPPIAPKGTYHGVVTGHAFGKSSQKQTPFVEFTATVQRAGDDIEPQDLAGVNLSGKTFKETFYLTPDAMWRLREFLESLGLTVKGRTIGEVIPDALNAQVIMYVDHEASRNNKNEDGSPALFAKLIRMKGE